MDTNVLDEISEETFQIFKAATNGINSSTGILGVDLADLISLVPVNTPLGDETARTGPNQGSDVAMWEALLNINNQQPKPSTALDAAGRMAKNSLMKVSSPYFPLAMGYTVTRDAIARARGYADAKARAVFSAIAQWKIGQDKMMWGAQNYALARPAAPTVTQADTGGSIAASTVVHVGVAARTGSGYFYCDGDETGAGHGNSQGNVGQVTTSTVAAATHAVSASTASVVGGACYDWFQSADGTTWHYYTTTTIPSVTMTSVITTDNTPPAALYPGLSSTTPTFSTSGDNGSAGVNEFNGLLATCTADYSTAGGPIIQHGTGAPTGSIIQDAAGSQFTISGGGIVQIDALNTALFNSIELSPHVYRVNAQEANSLAKLILNNPGAVTYLTMDDGVGRSKIVAGGRIGSYVNRITGDQVPIKVYPHSVPGTMIASRYTVPFPNGDVGNVFEQRCLDDMYDYVYGSDRASGGPRDDGEVRSLSTYINKAPSAQATLQSIAPTS